MYQRFRWTPKNTPLLLLWGITVPAATLYMISQTNVCTLRGFSNDRTSGTTLARRRTSRSCARRRSPRLSSRYASFVSIVRTYVREVIVPVLCLGVWGAACFFVRESLCTRKREIESISSPEDVRHCVYVPMRVCSFLCVTVHGIPSCPFSILHIRQFRQPTAHGPLYAPIHYPFPSEFASPARSRRWKRACHAKVQQEALFGVKVIVT